MVNKITVAEIFSQRSPIAALQAALWDGSGKKYKKCCGK